MTTMHFHVESSPEGAVWWAESPDVQGFTAAAPSLAELRDRCRDALNDIVGSGEFLERLVDAAGVPTHFVQIES